MHTHFLPNLSLSYARHTPSLNTTFLLLSTDYSKSLHLQADRSLEIHTPKGCHHTLRIPRYGRDLKYSKRSAEAIIPAAEEVYRLNLEAGRFMKPYEVAANTAAVAEESHNLLAFGTSNSVEFWDPRARDRIAMLPSDDVTALEFHPSGLDIAVGTASGLVTLFDMRSPVPKVSKDQGFGNAIHTLIYLEGRILSADKRIIKIWEADGTPWTSVEPAVDLHCVAWCKGSGMLLTANEGRQQHAFFIPQLGPAPKWCSFLDNVVEEMAEDQDSSAYDNFKFLTLEQLRSLSLDHLVGTPLLRPYMHGYFITQQLYDKAQW